MKKISFIFIALTAITLNGWSQSDVTNARRKSKEIIIDGNDHEWTKPLNFNNDRAGLLFAICNDSRNLYFAFSCKDEMKMRKILSAGWSVDLSSKEKNKKFNAIIIFPEVKKLALGIIPGSRIDKKTDPKLLINVYLSEIIAAKTKGFQSNQEKVQLNDQNTPADRINIALGADSIQNLVYEIAIPLKELLAETLFQFDEQIILSVTINELERTSLGGGQSEAGRPGGEMSEMGGGRSGGGRSGGGRGGSGGSRPGGFTPSGGSNNSGNDSSGLFERVSFKQKFMLTKN